jgi:histidinol-phosphate aminotransferase
MLKLEELLRSNGFLINKKFMIHGYAVYLEIFNINNAEIFLLYIPSKYEIYVEERTNAYKIKYMDLNEDDIVIYNHPEYTNFDIFVKCTGAKLLPFVDKDPFRKDLNKFEKFISINNPKLVYLSNPNNPTGFLYPAELIYKLLDRFPDIIFLIDEAYIHFSNVDNKDLYLSLSVERKNLVVTRTFSKLFSLAGLRIGYVVTNIEMIKHLQIIHKSKNVSMLGQLSAETVLNNYSFYENFIDKIKQQRELFINQIIKLPFVENVFDSQANFVCVKLKNNPSKFLDYLEKNGVFVRDRNSIKNLNNIFRTTIVPDMSFPIKIMKAYKEL